MKPTLTKTAPSEVGNLSYECPWCLNATSATVKGEWSGGTEAFSWVVCGHAQCQRPALIQVRMRLGTWEYLNAPEESHTIELFPPALPTYGESGVPKQVAEEFTEALRC